MRNVLLTCALTLCAGLVVAVPAAAQTNYQPHSSTDFPNNVSIPGMPTMFINGGGASKAGKGTAQFLHDWGKSGMESAKACDAKWALNAIKELQSYLNTLDQAYQASVKAGNDGSVILADANSVASIINYIRLALSSCQPPAKATKTASPAHSDKSVGYHKSARGITEDDPRYMENYQAPQHAQAPQPTHSNESSGYAVMPPPPPPQQDEPAHQGMGHDVPLPTGQMP